MNVLLMKHPTDPDARISCGRGPNSEGLFEVDVADVETAKSHGFVLDPDFEAKIAKAKVAAEEKAKADAAAEAQALAKAEAEAAAQAEADARLKARGKSKKSEDGQ